jgi:TolB-like protein/Flp pilus assembly protein TadD
MKFVVRLKRFVRELKRRRVFRVAVAYLAMAFILLQVAEIVLPALGQDGALTVVVVLAFLGFVPALVLAWAYDLSPQGIVRTPDLDEDEIEAAKPAARPVALDRRAVAVLPFKDMSGDAENRYFTEGIHEDILCQLACVGDLRVVSRTSVARYAENPPSLRQIGQELEVGSILEGSVRRSGNRIRVVAQLVDATDDVHLWAETYDRDLEDIFAIQSDVARQIALALEARLTEREAARIDRTPTVDLQAYDLFLRGRYLWNHRTEKRLDESLSFFREATERDPGFALAHAGLADAYVTLAIYNARPPHEVMPEAERAAARALEAEPELAEALTARACVRALYHWDWPGAEIDFRHAISANPGYATAPQWYAMNHLALLGRFDQARARLLEARRLDPVSPAIHASLGLLLLLEHRLDEAVAALESLLTEHPDFALGHHFLAQTLDVQGRHDEALAAIDQAVALRGSTPEVRSARGRILAAAGRTDEARAILTALQNLTASEYVSPTRLAQLALALGDPEAALAHLDRAVEFRSTDLAWVGVHPWFADLRRHPRYQNLADTLGLTEHARA